MILNKINLPKTHVTPIDQQGVKKTFKQMHYSEYDFIRELFGNMNKIVQNCNISTCENNGKYTLEVWWDDGGCDNRDKVNLTKLCGKSNKFTAGNNGLGIRNATQFISPEDNNITLVITKFKNLSEFLIIKGIDENSDWGVANNDIKKQGG